MPNKPKPSHLETQILQTFTSWFDGWLDDRILATKNFAKIDQYKINEFTLIFQTLALRNKLDVNSIAETLVTIGWAGQSLSTSFGDQLQKKFMIKIPGVNASVVKGIDIEYIDFFDKKRKYVQLKTGPLTINAGDVKPILDEFTSAKRLARQNGLIVPDTDFIMGVIYGKRKQINAHYLKIEQAGYDVMVGNDLFEHITGIPGLADKIMRIAKKLMRSKKPYPHLQKAKRELAKNPILKNYL